MAEGINRLKMKKILTQYTEHEKEAVRSIRDYNIRENGVSMLTASTLNPKNMERRIDNMTVNKINKMAVVVSKRLTALLSTTKRTDF